jgi:hypothetical protein
MPYRSTVSCITRCPNRAGLDAPKNLINAEGAHAIGMLVMAGASCGSGINPERGRKA